MNILITTAGRRTYIIDYFKKALEGIGRVIAVNSVYTYSLSHADDYLLVPSFYSENYVPTILDICRTKNIDAVISLLDADSKVLSEHHDEFKIHGISLIVSESLVMDICNDKWMSYKFLRSIGLPQPKTYDTIETVKRAIGDKEIGYPIIIKPRWGIGSYGVFIVEDEQELILLSSKIRREIMSTYMGVESLKDKERCVLFQEMIKGDEYGIEILNDLKGKYVTTFALKKLAMRSGETDVAETVDALMFSDLSKCVANSLGHIGILDVDCMVTSENEIYIIDMNCRFGGQYPFTHLANVNVPRQIVEWLMGKGNNKDLLTQKNGVRSCKELQPVLM